MSMIFVLMTYKEIEIWKHNAPSLYLHFSNLKTEFKGCLQRCKELPHVVLGPYMLELPNSFHELDASIQEKVFASQPPADPPVSVKYLQRLQSKIPLRKTNRQVSHPMNAFQSQPDWMLALMNALEGKSRMQSKQSIVLANGESLPVVASEGAASAKMDLMRLARDQAKQAQCIPSKALLVPEPPAPAQPRETIPAVQPETSPYQKIMDKLRISLEVRKNAKNQAGKADLDGPNLKLWPKRRPRQKPPKIRRAPSPNLRAAMR